MPLNYIIKNLNIFLNPFDGRFEDLTKGNILKNVFKDLLAGLVVAMVAIPLAMGFAIASGLRPEQGIVGGAVAGLLGALFGGSKYQVYGPTAAFIPLIAALMAKYDHGFLVFVSFISAFLLLISALFRLGRIVSLVPHSIVVGFTVGISIVIAFSQLGEIFGFKEKIGYGLINQLNKTIQLFPSTNWFSFLVASITFLICKILISYSKLIPAPVFGLGFGYLAANSFWQNKGLILIKDKFGQIPTDFWVITPPQCPTFNSALLLDVLYYSLAFYLVAAIESLLCSRMADRLAQNKGLPFNPDKELWGQGMVNIFTPLFNGFPHTGALARTAVNIKLGALSPLAGVAKFTFKLILAAFFAKYLELVPMACIGGILLYVASGMIKKIEIKEVLEQKNKLHIFLMVLTAILVPVFDFLTAVLTALCIYFIVSTVTKRFFK